MNSHDNTIHPTAILEGDIALGKGNNILPFCYLKGPLSIGDNNLIGPSVTIGTPGQNTREPRHDSSNKAIFIGSNNIIREFTAIQKPCFSEETRLGSNIFLMHAVHIPHDALIEDDVVITPMVAIAGSASILRGANLGMGCTIHQHTIVGQYCIIATGSTVVKNLKPFSKYIQGKPLGVNDYAIKKFGFDEFREEIHRYIKEDIQPTSPTVSTVVKRFIELHLKSERSLY